MQPIAQKLKGTPIFASLSDDQLQKILQQAEKITLTKGQILFQTDQTSTHFYYLISGQIKIARHSPQGLEKVLTLVHPSQLFAEAVMFLEKAQFPATATALESSEVIGFQNKLFTSLLRESHSLSMAMLSNLSSRLHKQIIEIDNLTMQNANYRLLNFLNNLIPENSSKAIEITLPGPKHTIASRLSITPETLSRVLNTLNQANIISLQGKGRHIDIPDVKKFRDYLFTH